MIEKLLATKTYILSSKWTLIYYLGIALTIIAIIIIGVWYPLVPEILLPLIIFVMAFYFVAEVVSIKLGVNLAILVTSILLIRAFFDGSKSFMQQHFISAILIALFVCFYFIVKKLRRGSLEKSSAREKYYRNLINVSLQPVLLTDSDGKIILASESIKEFLNLKSNFKFRESFITFVHSDDFAIYKHFYNSLVNKPNKIFTTEIRMRKSEKWIWVKLEAVNLLDNNNIKAIVYSLHDITIQKDIDKQKAELLLNEKKARAEAEKAVHDRDEFLSIASHELKTPLTTVILQLQATLRKISTQSLSDFSGAELLHSLQIAEGQSQNLSNLIKDLLNVSLASTGRITLKRERVDLVQLTKSLIQKYDAEIKLAECYVEFIVNYRELIGNWDIVRIEQAITNIFSNALKYAKGHKITITCEKENDWAILKIKDRGVGISETNLSKIFEPFNNTNPNHNTKGLGVGLFIAKQIITAHNGNIDVESQVGKGTTFIIKLPLIKLN